MKKTIRTLKGGVELDSGKGEFLTYALKRIGPGAIFVMTGQDTQDEPIFSEEDLGGKQQALYKWRFKAGNEKGKLTYRFRDESGGKLGDEFWQPDNDFRVFDLVLSFLFLGKYSALIQRVAKDGSLVETIVDVDYEGESNTDMAEVTLLISAGGV